MFTRSIPVYVHSLYDVLKEKHFIRDCDPMLFGVDEIESINHLSGDITSRHGKITVTDFEMESQHRSRKIVMRER